MQVSPIYSKFSATQVRPLKEGVDYGMDEYQDLGKVGIYGLDKINNAGFGMDAIQQGVTTGNITTPIQFLQTWLAGHVSVLTAAQRIDEIVGVMTAGSFEMEQVVQPIVENTGSVAVYSDKGNIPYSSWNQNFVAREIVRFEAGIMVDVLSEMRAAKMNINDAQARRDSAGNALNIQRNAVGFYGYNGGNNLTYGLLNDPSLLAYNTVATGAASTSKFWALKTFDEIINDIRTAVAAIQTQSQDVINPETVATTLVLPTNCYAYLSKISSLGYSVRQWIKENYPNMRIVSCPQFNLANAGSNVFYLFADKVSDLSTDDGSTFVQVVPAKFMVLGVNRTAKGYEEDYANATAGVMCKRPYAVYRGTGI